MLKNKLILTFFGLTGFVYGNGQILKLDTIIDSIKTKHPVVKMYDHEIRSMDEAAKGARSWMPPQIGIGQFMTPYDVRLWHREGDMPGMGSVMISGEQMLPNRKKLDADERYMKAMSSVEKEKKNATLNELVNDAKQFYYDWIILKKKLLILEENEKILDFMIKNAEIRYKNGLEKISAYYKAKAALGEVKNMQLMFESDIKEKRIRINSLMGRNAMTDFDIDTTYFLNSYEALVFDSTLFYTNRSDLKSLDREIDLTVLKQETERTALKPQFGIRYDNMIGFGGQPLQYTIMGMVRIPMAKWSSKMNKANIESLKWKSNAIQSQKEMMVNEYSGMAYGMRNELGLKKKQLKLFESQIIPALRNNYRTMQLGYEQNTEELFMLYDAWEILNMKQLELLELLSQALKLQVTIERIIEKN
ncbi:MAG TPA: TolC family protein [Sediminibacterium sp.]|jgi:outer membrane protein TolC|uniref:TolC family protein n=1 Tax=Sediminibacterium sp. TaxID=1917865 RepID=UPI0008D477C1|nr:TolC family protein [Sediminibacterium sp.]OHC85209.1 MAG: transporter [Sphingobacteriia bacterium RIFOXYC2_FULL_35_18]OHC89115.1 MAG: transporter [Sphingobacteriia bacterium RIFOXYD2_FULL_35_12]OYZ03100.1 MAG: transporter [Sphingobacteriia bacterium 28-36-52]MBW0177337.1 TolC family protein [Sediminibacterium sp.]HLD53488.1 TolC family protein [Sediminibacterium sp.]